LYSLLVVHDRFLQLELPATLAGDRIDVEREHLVGGEAEIPGEGGRHWGKVRSLIISPTRMTS
jgi:hypothetical protein